MRPDGALFDSTWRAACRVEKVSISEVSHFLERHYLRKRPAIVLLALLMTLHGVPIGCAVYSAPPREAEKRYGGKTWELARLYVEDLVPANGESWLIAKTVAYIRRHHADVEFLLSYADPSVGHSGTIYRASNWTFDGMTDSDRKSARCDYMDSTTGKKYGRRNNVPASAVIVRIPRVSKSRFVMPLRKAADA